MPDEDHDARLIAITELVQRTGAVTFGMRYSDDESPTVWLAVAEYNGGAWEADAGHSPLQAASRLAERLVDGGLCRHCGRPTALALEHDGAVTGTEKALCWYAYDPELKTFRRTCEGDS